MADPGQFDHAPIAGFGNKRLRANSCSGPQGRPPLPDLVDVHNAVPHSGACGGPLCLLRVCAVKRRRCPVGANPARQPLQPEATGAVMEETKWLKPSVSVSRIGDSASVQAVTRVNAEQASKRTMRRPT